MKVQKLNLLSILTKVRPGLAKKEIVEQASHFIFTKTDIATFNDRVCIIHPFESDIEFSVKGDDFYKIVDKISESEFEITLEDDSIKIKSKSTKAKLSTIVGETAMITPMIENIKQSMIGKGFWQTLPSDFSDGLYLCAFSASKDLSSGVKSCCAIRKDGLYTTDNIRVSTYIMEKEMKELLLPVRDVISLINYQPIEYGISENWAHFRSKEGVIFNCKIMKGEYPFDLLNGLFEDAPVTLEFPTNLRENVEAIISFAEGEEEVNKCISVTVEKGKIVCKAEKERGEIIKTVESDYEGEAFTFLINPIFLSQVLKKATQFVLLDGKGMFVSSNFYHLLVLPEV